MATRITTGTPRPENITILRTAETDLIDRIQRVQQEVQVAGQRVLERRNGLVHLFSQNITPDDREGLLIEEEADIAVDEELNVIEPNRDLARLRKNLEQIQARIRQLSGSRS